ncbi:MAG TPA: MASE1 domain-containing protein, partial [Candidatus Aquilonibacter sp.]|nr:MASE1 domain-containing protein [Candidatus Aquilonibacter sp.]
MNHLIVGLNRHRQGWRETAITIVVYLVVSQLLDVLAAQIMSVTGIRPFYPNAALDVLLLLLAGWRFWPVIVLGSVVHWALIEGMHSNVWSAVIVKTIEAGGFAVAVRYVTEMLDVSIPPRTLRDFAWFCGVVGIAAPIVVAVASLSSLVAINYLAVDDLPQQFSRFVLGDASAIVVLVPTVMTFLRWKQIRPPAEHQDPPLAEAIVTLVATALLVVGSHILSSITHETVLDLSF